MGSRPRSGRRRILVPAFEEFRGEVEAAVDAAEQTPAEGAVEVYWL